MKSAPNNRNKIVSTRTLYYLVLFIHTSLLLLLLLLGVTVEGRSIETTTTATKEKQQQSYYLGGEDGKRTKQNRRLLQDEDKEDVSALYNLLDRVLASTTTTNQNNTTTNTTTSTTTTTTTLLAPHYRNYFKFSINTTLCSSIQKPCFRLENEKIGTNDYLLISGTSLSEATAGIGYYLRKYCNITIGWKRGGGSNIVLPEKEWPQLKERITKYRMVPYTYLMNVCTHSYSLVWYNEHEWEQFIDWLALQGINLILALTGQEEIQYKVFRKLGLQDIDIRTWFNGPSFLTWSRGQNEYGNNICGPLPRSFMKDQWRLQKYTILPRLRELNIIGQLPGFQGNVPIQLQSLYNDTNMTKEGDTGWIDSLDPLYGKIADLWMETLTHDFGTDHWYQLDGYFNGGTAPWMTTKKEDHFNMTTNESDAHEKQVLLHDDNNNTVTSDKIQQLPVSIEHDETWYRRGLAAYTGLNRTDPDAIWSFQGFSFVSWSTVEQASYLKGFIDSVPKNKFVIIDMSYNSGEWTKWNDSYFFNTSFIWTTLHNFGGTDGMKGNLTRINQMPFDAMNSKNTSSPTSIIGSGATPEGIDQNPICYEFLLEQNFRTSPIQDLTSYIIQRSHQRYGLKEVNKDISIAWSLLVDSVYANDFSVQDNTGIAHLNPRGGDSVSMFDKTNRYTPEPILCKMYIAWKHLLYAVEDDNNFPYHKNKNLTTPGGMVEPFRYDLINLGREILAQISVPAVLNFTDSTQKQILNKNELLTSGNFYIELLNDTDSLVGTDFAFLLGPWIESARRWGIKSNDCFSLYNHNFDNNYVIINQTSIHDSSSNDNCENFYEWNARTQITTWNPTTRESTTIPGGPIDYAAKHWNGLIKDYYGKRASILLHQALKDEAAGSPLNETEVSKLFAQHAYNWTTATNKYPTSTTGDAAIISREMFNKYSHFFSSCDVMEDELVKSDHYESLLEGLTVSTEV